VVLAYYELETCYIETHVSLVVKEGKHMVKCKLNYFRKDRRERCYVMEDLSDSMRLMDILQPEVAKTQSRRKSADTMEVRKYNFNIFVKIVPNSESLEDI